MTPESRSNELTNVFMATEESSVLVGVLYQVRMKLAQADIQNPELEFEKTRGFFLFGGVGPP
jgi:hypothetical protein